MSIDYDRLREILKRTTPGPWVRHPDQPRALCNLDTKFLVHHEMVKNRGMDPSAEDVANTELIALAPDMAAELLRLRDGVKALVVEKRMWVDQLCDPYEEVLNPDWLAEVGGEEPIGLALEKVCRQLTDLLEGDTE